MGGPAPFPFRFLRSASYERGARLFETRGEIKTKGWALRSCFYLQMLSSSLNGFGGSFG